MSDIAETSFNSFKARLAISTALVTVFLGGYGGRKAYAGSCDGALGIYTCVGPVAGGDVTQSPISAAGGALTVTTAAGFGITTVAGDAIYLGNAAADTNITFTDSNTSAITGTDNGIYALNYGTGATSVAMTGSVTGTNYDGIYANNSATATSLTITTGNGAVTGGNDGIYALNYGTAGLTITAGGNVTGQTGYGIYAYNSANDVTASMTINQSAGTVTTGAIDGISAINLGGSLTINALGTSTGTADDGIDARNGPGTTDLTITANVATGANIGILAFNYGTGATSITTTGAVTGTNYSGILAYTTGSSLTITTGGNVSGGYFGIYTVNLGTGATSISTTGAVTGTTYAGIFGFASGTSLTITAGDNVSGSNDGIVAVNLGTGATSITTTGTVTGTSGDGIYAYNSGTSLTVTTGPGAVTGGDDGISANNYGSGAVLVTTNGAVTGSTDEGIDVYNCACGTSLTIVANGNVNGYQSGIQAINLGTGGLSITANGNVTSQTVDGIYAYNSANDITASMVITQAAGTTTSGAINGINANNFGGSLTISALGTTSGTAGDGIYARNYGTDLTITANAATGGDDGISANNYGSGAVSVTTTGAVSGNTDEGIDVYNSSSGTSLTIVAGGDVNGYQSGIQAQNYGTGGLSITVNGDVTSQTVDGIFAYNSANDITTSMAITQAAGTTTSGAVNGINANNFGGSLTINAMGTTTGGGGDGIHANNAGTSLTITTGTGAVTGGNDGIDARNNGTAGLTITAGGNVTGQEVHGINAYNSANDVTSSMVINQAVGTVTTGAANGINANNFGGSLTINALGTTNGIAGDGIYADNNAGTTSLTIVANNASGGVDGIDARNYGSGLASVTVSGTVLGGSGIGINTVTNAGSSTTIALNSGANVSATSGEAIANNAGDSATTVNTGASVTGAIRLNDGSDDLTFAGGDFSGVTLFDGGDDRFTADGWTDVLTFTGSSGALTGANVTNWEEVVIGSGSTISFSDNMLVAGTTTATNGGVLDAGSIFALTGDLVTSASGIFDATGGGSGVFNISGSATNNGIFTMQDGSAGDVITVSGNYSGTGELRVDVDFATDISDTLVVASGVTGGTTTVSVNDVSSAAASGNDVLVVDVTEASVASGFNLAAPVISGAYQYDLGLVGSDWYLQSTFNAAIPTYEVYPQILLGLAALPTLQQRVGNRYWSGDGVAAGNGSRVDHQGDVWGRFEGSDAHAVAKTSTTGSSHDVRQWKFQAGLDGLLHENAGGRWIIGLTGQHGTASTDIFSSFGNGSISTKAGGLGITTTWYGNSGFYFDGQAQLNWFDSDLRDVASGLLVEDNRGRGYSFGLEAGKRVETEHSWTFTPQAQLVYSRIFFDSFTGPNGETVSLDDGDSLRGRIGISFDHECNWKADDGTTNRSHFYGIANLHYQFIEGTQVEVSTVKFANEQDKWSGEIGLGGSLNWADGKYALYGEVSVATGLENFADSYSLNGTAGIKIQF